MQKFILIIQGPLCAGKSTVVKSLLAEHENLFYASFDRIKWLISHYDAKKHNIIKANLAFALSKEALANNLSVIVECGKQLEWHGADDYRKLATENDAKFVHINIEAPLEVLQERFHERIEDNKVKKGKISVTNIEWMLERYNTYLHAKDETIPTFDSGKLSPEELYNEIMKLLIN